MRFRTDVGERLNPSKTQMGNGRKEHKAMTMTDRVTPQVCAVLTLRLPLKRKGKGAGGRAWTAGSHPALPWGGGCALLPERPGKRRAGPPLRHRPFSATAARPP